MTATGGSSGAGIGGGSRGTGGTITINGGTINATGGSGGAGIGGGYRGERGPHDTITINGGTVTAKGGYKWLSTRRVSAQVRTILAAILSSLAAL